MKELIIWKFKAGEADLWLSMPCHGALTQTDLKEKALKKKWSTLNSQFIGLIIIVLEKADRNLYC